MNVRQRSVLLPAPIDAALRQEAARRGIAVSALAREAIAAHLGMHAEGTTDESDDSSASQPRRRLSFTGAGASGRSDISERIEEILREDFGRRGVHRRTDPHA